MRESFRSRGKSSPKALKWETALHIQGLARRPGWLRLGMQGVGKSDRGEVRGSKVGRELLILL